MPPPYGFIFLQKINYFLNVSDDLPDISFTGKGLIFIVVVAAILFISAFLLGRNRQYNWELPRNVMHYYITTIRKHWLAYVLTVALPVLASLIFKWHMLSIFGLWGVLITTLSAYYATRASYFSDTTLSSVIQFSDNLEIFIRKLRYEILLREKEEQNEDSFSMRFLTVIPAFGSIGEPEVEFHKFLFERIRERNWKLNMLTHDLVGIKEWLKNIYQISESDSDGKNIEKKTSGNFEMQKNFLDDLSKLPTVGVKIWNVDGISNSVSQAQEKNAKNFKTIPFQLFITDSPKAKRVFFLFSGDFLYGFVFKLLKKEDFDGITMERLSGLTKGFFTEDGQIVKLFTAFFDKCFTEMPEYKNQPGQPIQQGDQL